MTWKKQFDNRFKNPENTGYRVGQEFLGAVEQFITDIRKHDEEELIKRFPDNEKIYFNPKEAKQLIKDYYKE